jgi:DNA helicase II / ATP-dependent DNA helicase PcrA
VSHTTQDIIQTILERQHSYYLINAAPGSGKTTLLLELGRQLPQNTKALFLSFNRQNVSRLKTELAHKHSVKSTYALGLSQLSTLHARAAVDKEKYSKLWRSEAGLVDLKLDDFSQKVLLQAFHYARLNLFNFSRQKAKALIQLLEPYPLDKTFEDEVLLHSLKVLFKAGVAEFKRSGAIDFTDMAALPYYLFAEKNSKQPQKWPLIAIDEAQDLSRAQLELILLSSTSTSASTSTTTSTSTSRGVVVMVGDEHQAVQGFAGALSNSIQQIRDLTKPHELALPISYRCPILHLELINQIYPGANPRVDAPFGEVYGVDSSEYLTLLTAGDMVIARSNRYLLEPCLKLQIRGQHAKILGLDGAERLRIHLEMLEAEPGFTLAQLPEFIEQKIGAEKMKAGSDPKTLLHVSRLEDQLQSLALVYRAAGGINSTRARILAIIRNLFSDVPEGILFCTAHRAKGLEAQRVFIVYPEGMPNRLALEQGGDAVVQEENLRYVAISRAKQQLFFVCDDPSNVLHWIPEPYHEVWLERGVIDSEAKHYVSGTQSSGVKTKPRRIPIKSVRVATVKFAIEPIIEPVIEPEVLPSNPPTRKISAIEKLYISFFGNTADELHSGSSKSRLPFSDTELELLKLNSEAYIKIELARGIEKHMIKMLKQIEDMSENYQKLSRSNFHNRVQLLNEVDNHIKSVFQHMQSLHKRRLSLIAELRKTLIQIQFLESQKSARV